MREYYTESLSGARLRQCYDLASARVKQYLEAEIEFVVGRLHPGDRVLDLGCGYGRVAVRLADTATHVVGIDTSSDSLTLARELAGPSSRCRFVKMDASMLAFQDRSFDRVVCVQNGICAFAADPEGLLAEALRVSRPGGTLLFSSYAPDFWSERLAWFESQAAAGLVGAIDYDRTRRGTIVCKDGFSAGTFEADAFHALCRRHGVESVVTKVDDSSVFCEALVPGSTPTKRSS